MLETFSKTTLKLLLFINKFISEYFELEILRP